MALNHQILPASEDESIQSLSNHAHSIGLYIHIPFCRSKCNYCAFVSAAPKAEEEIGRYVNSLCKHLQAGKSIVDKRELSTIYLGGGTPSLIGAEKLSQIFETIHSCFTVLPDAEITLEANPESAARELFEDLKYQGLNRVSLGAQSFHNDELARIGRIHSAQETVAATERIRAAGIDNVSLDLIFALPGQTLERWQSNLNQALACNPSHISTYGLTYEEGTLLDRLRSQGKVTPVLDETYIKMYDWTRSILADRGWSQYEISNWCQPGKESWHNQLYWLREDYLATGVSAHGMIDSVRYSIIKNTNEFVRITEDEGNGSKMDFWHPQLLEEHVQLSSGEMASDVVIFGLRRMEGISIPRFCQRFGYNPLDRWSDSINRLCQQNMLEQSGEYLRLTNQAVPVSNEVFVHFLD